MLPEGPTDPKILQLMQWVATPISFMRRCHRRFGDSFTVNLTRTLPSVVFVSDPQSLQTILANDDSELFDAPGEANAILRPLLGAQSLIGLSGEPHRRMRQLLMPSFHGERMRSYGGLIRQIAESTINEWEGGVAFRVRKATQKISLRIILRAVFGLEDGERYRLLERLLGTLLDSLSHPFAVSSIYVSAFRRDLGPVSPWGRFLRLRNAIDQLIFDEIGERQSGPGASREDILSLLMSARDEKGGALTDQELRDELMTLLVAGHETTATALAWALHWIHRLPDVRQRLISEIEEAEDPCDPACLQRLPYLNAVCAETLRIHPIGMLTFPRIAKARVQLASTEIEPGTVVAGCIYLAHHRTEVYPEPDGYRPERFLERRFTPYEYLPFGGGVRRCIGMAFAQFEMKIVLAAILRRVELEHANSRPVRLVRRGLTSGPTPFRMRVRAKV